MIGPDVRRWSAPTDEAEKATNKRTSRRREEEEEGARSRIHEKHPTAPDEQLSLKRILNSVALAILPRTVLSFRPFVP